MFKLYNKKEKPKRMNDKIKSDSNDITEHEDKIEQLESKISKKYSRGLIFIVIGVIAMLFAMFLAKTKLRDALIDSNMASSDKVIICVCAISFCVGFLACCWGFGQFFSVSSLEREHTNLEIKRKKKEREQELKNITVKGYIRIRYEQALDDRDRITIYRDNNIFQQQTLFALGMTAMLFGLFFLILGVVLLFISNIHQDISIIIFGLCGIISETIGAFVIKMYSENLKVSIKYSSDIIHNDDIIFAHALATDIKDEERKEQTMSDLAKLISKVGSGTKE